MFVRFEIHYLIEMILDILGIDEITEKRAEDRPF